MFNAHDDSEAGGTQHVITLVHGTWAKKAEWIRPHSAFSKALRDRLGKEIKIFRFVWSGRNSPLARRKASERLKKKLALRLRDYGAARHHIVCHSHGGDVALRALAGSDLQEKICGVVCLATPFLVARERDLGSDPIKYLSVAVVEVGLLTMWVGGAVLPPSWPELWRLAVEALLLALVISASLLLFMKWREYAGGLLGDLTPPTIAPDKILIVRSPADEASGILIFGQFISQVTVLLFLKAQRLYERFELAAAIWAGKKKSVLAVGVAALASFYGFLIAHTTLTSHGFACWTTNLTLAGVYGSILVMMEAFVLIVPQLGVDGATIIFRLAVAALIWPMILLLSIFLVLPFGWQVALANILLDVSAEVTPVSSGKKPWPVHLVGAPTRKELGKAPSALMHSRVYENPRVLGLMCEWIAGRLAQPTGAADVPQAPRR